MTKLQSAVGKDVVGIIWVITRLVNPAGIQPPEKSRNNPHDEWVMHYHHGYKNGRNQKSH